jgi:hypothetical protein
MSTREILRSRPDVPDEAIDDIIAEAARLQDADQDAASGPTTDDVRAVAAELDIDPRYVDEAIASLADRRAAQEADAAAATVIQQERAARRRKLLVSGGISVAALLGLVLLGTLGLGWSSARAMYAADDRLAAADANLLVVQQRQATLAPQLVALAGGQAATLTEQATALQRASSPEERQQASDALGLAMATALGSLPPTTDPASSQQRADLQHEVAGITNRLTVEARRVADARVARDQAHRGTGARIARGIGLYAE